MLFRNRFSRGSSGRAVAVAWLSYLPVPGLPFVAVWLAPEDPLTRYHAWQGGILVGLAYALLIILGLLARLSDAAAYLAVLGLASGLLLLAVAAGIAWGIIGAARRRYVRVRPVWDMLAAARR